MFRLALLCLFGLTYSRVSAEQGTEAIVGGDYARAGDFKYHVYMQHPHQQCGGAIIADQYILTAAHCVTDGNNHIIHERVLVVAGTRNIYETHGPMHVNVKTIFIPKLFNRYTKLHDIAILKLAHSLELSHNHQKVEKISLPKPDAHFDNVCGIVTGFGDQEVKVRRNSHGHLEEYDTRSDGKMKFGNVKVITNERCSELNHRQIPPTHICGQMLQRKHPEGTCSGDSGGPLVYGDEVIGILISSPFGCSEANSAATYTRVSSYLHFINSVIHGKPGDDVAFADVPH